MEVPEVASNSRCWCFTGTNRDSAIVYLLNQIAGGTMTAEEVAENSRCWCFTGSAFERAVTYLLAQIQAGGGGGGGGSAFTVGTGSPEGAVSGSPGDRFWASDTGFEWTKVTGAATTTGWLVH